MAVLVMFTLVTLNVSKVSKKSKVEVQSPDWTRQTLKCTLDPGQEPM